LYDLNRPVSNTPLHNITGYALADKVNSIEKVGKWVISALQNGSVHLYDINEKNAQPVAEYKPSRAGSNYGEFVLTFFSYH
jgi:hypothetical protein